MNKFNIKNDLSGIKIALIGAGVSNMPLVGFLKERGAEIIARDSKTKDKLGERALKIEELGASLICGDNYLKELNEDVIIRSPGIRPDIPEFEKAVQNGAILTSEMELFLDAAPCPVYAVTGSDGKSTTTTILSKLLAAVCDGRSFLGGNIGEPLLHRYPQMNKDDKVAVELSSFQLMTIDAPLEAAVITNITPNHLNWHTGMDEYIEAKRRILRKAKRAVLNFDNEITRAIGKTTDIPVTYFSRNFIDDSELKEGDGAIYIKSGDIVRKTRGGEEEYIMSLSDILLPGLHNAENYMAAIAAAGDELTGDSAAMIARTFGGVEHRLEFVRELGGVRYYNGSIDSSPTRTAAAISALSDTAPDRRIVIICGGYDKNIPFEPLAEAILSEKLVKYVVLTGATADKIRDALTSSSKFQKRSVAGDFDIVSNASFDKAVETAAALAKPGDTVLLSPACASFDAFENFEARGRKFKEIVRNLSDDFINSSDLI